MVTREENTIDSIDGDRGMPSVNARQPTSVKKGLGVLFLVGVMLLGLGLAYFWFVRGRQAAANKPIPKAEQLQSSVPTRLFQDAPPPPPEAPQEAAVPIALASDNSGTVPMAQPAPSGPAQAPRPPRPYLDKSASGLMVTQGGARAGASGGASAAPQGAPQSAGEAAGVLPQPSVAGEPGGNGSGPLGGLLGGARTDQAGASMIGNRNFLLAKGSFIDCVLQTKLDTTVPGMSACVITRNLYSDNGKVLLVERGSTVTGEYQQGLQQGQNRIFVLWTRVKTPNGVVISLDSPGTDALGASGLQGKVNRHFFQRFGAAMLLSVIDDSAAALANSTKSTNGSSTNNYGNTSQAANDMAAKALESTINIPPTLYKNQGERINIFVARDLNFGGVYALRAR